MNIADLCMGCMAPQSATGDCPVCGYRDDTQADSPLHLPPRTVLHDQYLVGRVLGHGGFGITYLTWDLNLEVRLALKEYLPRELAIREAGSSTVSAYSSDTREHFQYGLEKFIEEARTLAKFHEHPGIVTVHNFFRANGTGYMVMQYVDGVTLKQYLESQGGKIGYDMAVKILMPVMDALRELHGVGLLHRDISPDNIYITESKRVKLLDFGAARYAAGEHSRSLSVILKPGYAPEEQYRSKGKQGPWTDVYALCATLYRAITGETPPESLDRMDEDELVQPSDLGITLPSSMEAVLMKGLAIRSAERWQAVQELQGALMGGIGETQPAEPARPKAHVIKEPPPAVLKQEIKQPLQTPKPALAIEEYRPGHVFRDGPDFPEMVVVPAGKFVMGSPSSEEGHSSNEAPQHEVIIGRSFAVGKYPVTFEEWDVYAAEVGTAHRPDDEGWGRSRRPVINVSWNDAQEYVAWLTKKTGQHYRLLTEAEWEYAARSGSTTAYYWGNEFVKGRANVRFDTPTFSAWVGVKQPEMKTTPVGNYLPNSFGLYDMSGNVWEWVEDCFYDSYNGAPVDGSAWASGEWDVRALRGGSWNYLPDFARSAFRGRFDFSSDRNYITGFRLARMLP